MPIDASTLTPQQQITAIYVAYYDRAPDPAGLQFWVDQLNGGRSLEQIATDFSGAAETIEKYPFFDAPDVASGEVFINAIYTNLFGRSPDAAGLEFWTNQLESGSTPVGEIILAIFEGAQDTAEGDDLSTVQNKIEAGLDWATDAAEAGVGISTNLIAEEVDGELVVNNQAAFNSATSILDGVTGDPATVAEAAATTDAFFGANLGQTFTLTEGSDQIPGLEGSEGTTDTSGDDLILAGASNIGGATNTLGSGDNLNGGEGFDTLRVVDGDNETFTPTLSNIESVEVQATGGTSTVNMINTDGVEQAWNYRSTSNVSYTNVQAPVIAGAFDTNTRLDITYENGVDLGGEVSLVVDGAGVDTDAADVYVNSDDAANLTDLNVMTGETDSYVNVDVDASSAPGAVPAAFENLTVAGAGGLLLREANGEGETDFVTMVDATGLEGFLDLDLSANDQNIDFDGGNGNTTLITGDGDSDILAGAGDDDILVGDGDNTINTGAGADMVAVGNGNNDVDTGVDNDVVDITAGGDQTVMLGDGDDVLLAGSSLTVDDAVEAGDGEDLLVVDVAHAAAFTANGDVDAVVNGFEVLGLQGTVADGDSFTVNLDNIDDIDHVITEGTQEGTAATGTFETVEVAFEGLLEGQSVTIGGTTVTATADWTATQVAEAFDDNATVTVGGATYNVADNAGTGSVVLTAQTVGDKTDVTASVNNTSPAAFNASDVVAETQGVAGVASEAEVAEVGVSGLFAGESTTVTDNENGGSLTVTGVGVTESTTVTFDDLYDLFGEDDSITINGLTVAPANGTDASAADVTQAFLTGTTTGNAVVSGSYNGGFNVTSSGVGSLTYTSTVPNANVSDLPVALDTSLPSNSATTQGEDGDLTAAEVASALAGNTVAGADVTTSGTFGYTAVASGSTVTFTATAAGAMADLTASSTGGVQPTVNVTNQGVDAVTAVTEEADVSFEALNSGESITVAGRTVTADGGDLTAAEVEAAYLTGLNGSTVTTGNATVTGTLAGWTVAEDAGGAGNSELTFTSTTAGANVADIETTFGITQAPAPTAPTINVTDGTATGVGGILNLEYVAPGGTLELEGANRGVTNVVIDGAAAGMNDDFNIVLATSDNHDGVVDVTGVETLMVETQADAVASDLGLVADDVETLVVTGTAGVDFIDNFASLTSVDASALTIETDDEGVSVTTDAMDDATLTGSAGEDVFFSGSGDDVIMGGTGNDEIHGRGGDDMIMGGEGDDDLWGNAGTDVLTGGAGEDTFHYTDVSDSQGTTVDTITDFVSGEDILDFSAITGGTGSYTGEANGYGAVLTSLQSTGDAQAVLDTSTSTLYVDVNGDGNLDDQDMAIDLTGVTALDNNTDFTF